MNKIKLEIQKKKSTKVIFFRINEDIYKKIEKIAKRKKAPISSLMRAFVEMAIKTIK